MPMDPTAAEAPQLLIRVFMALILCWTPSSAASTGASEKPMIFSSVTPETTIPYTTFS